MIKIFDDYEIDENGNIYSHKSNKFLKPFLDRYGYLYVRINNKHHKIHNKKGRSIRIRIETFIRWRQICINGNKKGRSIRIRIETWVLQRFFERLCS